MIGVTGANGLLGSFIVRRLIDDNQPFIAFRRTGADTSLLDDIQDKIQWRDLNVLDPVSMEDALQGITRLIHSAALLSFNPRDTEQLDRVNTEGTRNLVNASLANGIRRFLYVSSVAALGRTKGQASIDENNKWTEQADSSAYARSKYHGELEVFRAQEEGLSTIIVNPSVILAPADWHRSSARLFRYIWDEHRFYIDGSLNYVDGRDAAAAIVALLNSGMENERFIINAGSVSFKAFFDAVATRFGKKPPMTKLSKNFVKIAAGIDSLRARALRTGPLITPEMARLADTYFLFENKKIKNRLGFEFLALDHTLDWCCQYYLQRMAGKKSRADTPYE